MAGRYWGGAGGQGIREDRLVALTECRCDTEPDSEDEDQTESICWGLLAAWAGGGRGRPDGGPCLGGWMHARKELVPLGSYRLRMMGQLR